MAVFKIRAIAPPIDPPLQWGSNIFIVGSSLLEPSDQGLNHQFKQTNRVEYTFQIQDFTTDTVPPFEPRPGYLFDSIKLIDIVYHDVSSDGMTLLTLNGNTILTDTIITSHNLATGAFKMVVLGGAGGDNTYIKAKVLYSDKNGEYPPETATEITFVASRKGFPGTITFNPSATILISNPLQTIGATQLKDIFNISMPNVNVNAWHNANDIDLYFNLIQNGIPPKIEFRNLDGCDAIEYYGKPILLGQRIQIQAFMEGNVKVRKSRLNREYNIEIAIGHGYTGRFRVSSF